jgi:hypothetical protein
MMFGGNSNAVVNHDNFSGNNTDIDNLGGVTGADFTQNYWESGAPSIGGYDTSNTIASEIAEAGPRI